MMPRYQGASVCVCFCHRVLSCYRVSPAHLPLSTPSHISKLTVIKEVTVYGRNMTSPLQLLHWWRDAAWASDTPAACGIRALRSPQASRPGGVLCQQLLGPGKCLPQGGGRVQY